MIIGMAVLAFDLHNGAESVHREQSCRRGNVRLRIVHILFQGLESQSADDGRDDTLWMSDVCFDAHDTLAIEIAFDE